MSGGSAGAAGSMQASVLVVIDMQRVFAASDSPWFAPRFAEIVEPVRRLIAAHGERTILTRFVAPEHPEGAWIEYYRAWPFALQPPDAPAYEIVDDLAGSPGSIVTTTTFSKWTPELAALVPAGARLVLCGVSTDCCVLTTALAAADAGVPVVVAADACAGANDETHEQALAVLRLFTPIVEIAETEVLADR